jgi:chemosensory pili system protein ChpA (sensor histidine kinase/response regulator)
MSDGGFSIDDVRDSFRADVSAQARKIAALGEAVVQAAGPALAVGEGEDFFARLGESCHAIHGTSGLLALPSLRRASRALHDLADRGRERLAVLRREAEALVAYGQAYQAAAAAVGQMLELELQHRSSEAVEVAEQLLLPLAALSRFDGAPAGAEGEFPAATFDDVEGDPVPAAAAAAEAEPPPALEDIPAPEGFDFEDDSRMEAALAPPPPAADERPDGGYSFGEEGDGAAEAGGLSEELVEVFRQEARESLVALHGHLHTLAHAPSDPEALESLERLFHTFKGAAATVGLSSVAGLASELRRTVEAVLEGRTPPSAALADTLLAGTNRLLVASGLPELELQMTHAVLEPPVELGALFVDEAHETCQQLADGIVELSDHNRGPEERERCLADLARLFHRLRGSAMLAAATAVAEQAGALQELCEAQAPSERLQEEVRRGFARLRRLLDGGGPAPRAGEALGYEPLPPRPAPAVPAPVPVQEDVEIERDATIWEAFEHEASDLLERIDRAVFALEESSRPKEVLEDLLRQIHTLKGAANTVGLKPLGRMLHRVEDFIEELLEAAILPPLRGLASLLLDVQARTRRNLAEAGQGSVETDPAALEAQIEALRQPVGAAAASHGSSSVRLRPLRDSQRSMTGDELDPGSRRTVRVPTERLDALMNLTGELVVSRSRLARRVLGLRGLQRDLSAGRNRLLGVVDRFRDRYEFAGLAAAGSGLDGFSDLELDRYGDVNILARSLHEMGSGVAEVQDRIMSALDAFSEDAASFGAAVSSLQEEITRARMVPLEQLFLRLRLPVRDAAEREGKSVRVRTVGEDVALDKTILDQIYLPMLHVVRNAVAHGIESPEARRAAGKDPVGTVTLQARQESGRVVIEVADDGAGLDLLRLKELAVRAGALAPDVAPDDQQVHDAIFLSGLSTRGGADAVSGRGVGGDVARRDIERLNGTVHARGVRGAGTRITIVLPLTLVVTRALFVRHRQQVYAIPLNFAERILSSPEADVHESAGVRRVRVDGVYEVLKPFEAVLGQWGSESADPPAAVVLRVGERRIAIGVDAVLGQEEVVVKSLGEVLTGHPLFTGVTVSGEGDLILIVDVPALMAGQLAGKAAAPEAAATDIREADVGPPDAVRALFVDDSLSVRKVGEKFLASLGVDVTLAVDGQDALARMRQARFDIVFTDLEMPRLHGYELIREIRATPALAELPVVVVTSRSGQKHRDQAETLGASDYLTKPFTPQMLEDALRRRVPRWTRR